MIFSNYLLGVYLDSGWIISLIIDLTVIFMEAFDSMVTNESNLYEENTSIEIASKNIAKISLKEVVRVIIKEGLRMGTEVFLKSVANKTLATLAKKLPLYGLVFGVVFAINRIAQNRKSIKSWVLACFEIISGSISIIPYIGKF